MSRMHKIFAGLLALLAIYEVAALRTIQSGDTISEIIWALSSQWPIVPFIFGVICGHLFWQRKR